MSPCQPFKIGESVGFVCGRSRSKKPEPCFVRDCRRPSEVLCDWFLQRPAPGEPEPPRCSRPCCRHHAKHVDVDKDLCLEHALRWDKEKAKGKV